MASRCIKCCRSVKHFPSRLICVLVLILQGCVLDYYLVHYMDIYMMSAAAADVLVIVLFLVTFYFSYRYLQNARRSESQPPESRAGVLPLAYITWFLYGVVISIKVAVSFKQFSYKLEEETFFGENTLKTANALAGVVFLLLLSTHHDSKPGSDRRKYIEELTGTVIFDILDGVDSLEILFDKDARDNFLPGLEDAIIGIACINFILPTIPLITLSKSKFGTAKIPRRMVMLHKVILAFMVNLPLLITRMIVWHGLGNGISIFSLKNLIIICVVCADLYEHFEGEEKESSKGEQIGDNKNTDSQDGPWGGESYAMEDRFNY